MIDIAFTRAKLAVLIDDCFWHGCPEYATSPEAIVEWWREKLDRKMERGRGTNAQLLSEGWTVLRFWERESPDAVMRQVAAAVDRGRADRRK